MSMPVKNIRIASRREPPAPREQDREERSGPTWPNHKPTGVKLALALRLAEQEGMVGRKLA